jgi:hypothetical protein
MGKHGSYEEVLGQLILTLQHQLVNSIQKSTIVENNIWSRAIAQCQH